VKIIRSREHTCNLGNYENVKIGAAVEFDTSELAGDIEPAEYAGRMLDDLLRDDLAEALANVPTGGKGSHLETWQK
jgi:hypothetical protein